MEEAKKESTPTPKQKGGKRNKKDPNSPKKIQKFALMSPYLSYYEVMPAKAGKDFVSHTLSNLLVKLHKQLPQSLTKKDSANEVAIPPPTKRHKPDMPNLVDMKPIVKDLQQNKMLMIGLNQVQKVLIATAENDELIKEHYEVLILNDSETTEITKHIVGFCRQFGFHNYLLPKFLKKNCCELFGVKKLTCFGIKIEDEEMRQSLNELKEFDNHPENRESIDEHRYAEETIFKTCYIKRWQVEIKPKK